MLLGPILTHSPDLPSLRHALSVMRATALKVVTAWGLPGGWTPATRAEAAHLCPTLIVRTVAGDPSYADGAAAIPFANQVLDEEAPWARVRPDLVVEIGNEPLNGPRPVDPHEYAYHLGKAIDALRLALPQARILGPAFSLNPAFTHSLPDWLSVLGAHLRRCDGFAIHAYTPQELAHGLSLAAQHAPGLPIWLTECNIGEPMPDAERARRLWAMVAGARLEAALVYHLDASAAATTAEQGPSFYRLGLDTLATLGMRGEPTPAPVLGAAVSAVEWAGMTTEHYGRGRAGGSVRGVVIHATGGTDSDGWLRKGGDPSNPISAHYLVRKDGTIRQYVRDDDTAWHAGVGSVVIDGVRRTNPNAWTIGIELENRNDGRDPYPAAQLAAAAALTRALVDRYRIPRSQVVRHLDVAPGRKSDPAGLDWPAFLAMVFDPADPWADWGTAHPLPPEQRDYSIPARWRAEQQAGRPLGAATGPEQALARGRAARAFERGVIVWLGGTLTEVLRQGGG